MTARFHRTACLAVSVLFAQTLGAQTTRLSTPTVPQCYRLVRGEWSRSLGVNARYHALPAVIRLDTARAAHGGWMVAPDIAFPTPNRFAGTPRWIRQADTVEIVWSNGYQVTTVRLGSLEGDELRGTATIRSDANEFGSDIPHASIVARLVSCATLASPSRPSPCEPTAINTDAWPRDSGSAFVIRIMPGLPRRPLQGVDSEVGQWYNGFDHLWFDYGAYSNRLDDSTHNSGTICHRTVGGRPARIVVFRDTTGEFAVAAYWAGLRSSALGPVALTVSARARDSVSRDSLLAAILSVRFK